jgi:polygalacturonase
MNYHRLAFCLLPSLAFAALAGHAQDPRNVQEPVLPPVCATLAAQLTSGTAPGTLSSETQLDTGRIQSALSQCAAGEAVELAPGTGADAFLIGPISVPSGVTLIVDAGVTVYASCNPRDYDNSSAQLCGTLDSKGSGCKDIFNLNNTVGSGIMGYGTIDGRGYMPLLLNGQPGPEMLTCRDWIRTILVSST